MEWLKKLLELPEPIQVERVEEERDKRIFDQQACDEFSDYYISIGGDVSNYDVEKVVSRFKY